MMVKNSVKEVVEINVDFKELQKFCNMIKSYGDNIDSIGFTSDGSIKATDGYSAYTINKIENLTNTSVNVMRSRLLTGIKDIKKGAKILGVMEEFKEVSERLLKVKDGLITIKIEPSTQFREEVIGRNVYTSYSSKKIEKIKQDKVTMFLNGDLIECFYQDTELTFPDLEMAIKGMTNIHTEVTIPRTSKEQLIKELKEGIKKIKEVSRIKKPKLMHMNIVSIDNVINFSTEFFDLDNREHDLNFSIEGFVKGDELNCKIDALKLLNYLENESLPNIHIEVNSWSNSFQNCFKLNCSEYKSKFIMLIRP